MLEALRRRAGRFGLDLVLVNVWEGVRAAREAARYCEMWGIEATVLLDEAAQYARTLGVRGVPTNVFVDGAGIVRGFGASTAAELVREAVGMVPGLAEVCHDLPGLEQQPEGFAERQSGFEQHSEASISPASSSSARRLPSASPARASWPGRRDRPTRTARHRDS